VLKTAAEIAKHKDVSRAAICKYLLKHEIKPSGMKGKYPTYDCGKEPLKTYFSATIKKTTAVPKLEQLGNPDKTEPTSTAVETPTAPQTRQTVIKKISKPLNDLLADKLPEGQKPSSVFYAKAVKIAEANQDAGLLLKLAAVADKENREEEYQTQRLKTELANEQIAIEKAARLKLENNIRRERFIDRATVKLLFGKTYAIHTSILTPLSLKLSSTIAAIPAGEKREETIRKLIDDEIFAALGSIQRLLVDFVENGEKTT
jgi:hypothetical protein